MNTNTSNIIAVVILVALALFQMNDLNQKQVKIDQLTWVSDEVGYAYRYTKEMLKGEKEKRVKCEKELSSFLKEGK